MQIRVHFSRLRLLIVGGFGRSGSCAEGRRKVTQTKLYGSLNVAIFGSMQISLSKFWRGFAAFLVVGMLPTPPLDAAPPMALSGSIRPVEAAPKTGTMNPHK